MTFKQLVTNCLKILLCSTIIVYGISLFIWLTPNPLEWGAIGRGGFLISIFFFPIVSFLSELEEVTKTEKKIDDTRKHMENMK